MKRPLIYRLLRLHGGLDAVRRGKGGAPCRPAVYGKVTGHLARRLFDGRR